MMKEQFVKDVRETALSGNTVTALLDDYITMLTKSSREAADAFTNGLDSEDGFKERAMRVVASTVVCSMLAITLEDDGDYLSSVAAVSEDTGGDPRLSALREEIAGRILSMNKNMLPWTGMDVKHVRQRMAELSKEV